MLGKVFADRGLRKAKEIDHAGWGRTVLAGIVSFIYFLPVLVIIITAFKEHVDVLAVPAKLFPFTLFGLIPEQFTFTPTLENFVGVFSRSFSAGAEAQDTGFDLFFFNSIFIAGSSVLIALVIGTLAAFGFSRYPLK
ncbi:MAG: carbohydrate ABC transporter permease, partial [Pseudomonadota bacterium]